MRFNQVAFWFRFFSLAVAMLCIFILSACTDNGASNESDTGALSFKITYHDSQSYFQPKAAKMDCAGLNVKTVEAKVYNENKILLADGGPWNCNDGHGTIASVQAGNGFNVVVFGKDSAGRIIFSGQETGIRVVAGTDNNTGNIDCLPFVPTPQAPTDREMIKVDDIVLKWSKAAGATKYHVVVSENSDLTKPVIDDTTFGVTFTPSGLEPEKTYFWQVYAMDSHGKSDMGSTSWSFTCIPKDSPILSLKDPKDQTTIDVSAVVLIWSEVAGTPQYHVIVSENSDLTQPVIDDITTGVTFTPSGLLESNKTYYWQVQTMDSNGKSDFQSTIWSFSLADAPSAAQITCPLEGIIYTQGDTVEFTSQIKNDAQLNDNTLVWSSNLSGEICKGNTCSSNSLIAGTHHITLISKNANGPENTDSVSIIVNAEPAGGKIPDTGQTTSYTDTFGEDADYIINPPAYTKLDAAGQIITPCATEWAMVKDEVTGLIWEMKTDDDTVHDVDNRYAWQDLQKEFIAPLNNTGFGGYSDWRVPTIKELYTLMQFIRANPIKDKKINATYFPKILMDRYWSSTPHANTKECAWLVNFDYGTNAFDSKSEFTYVLAVRGTRNNGALVDNGDGTITDTATGLMWQQAGVEITMWEEALDYCEKLELADHDDWRLPNIKELLSIIDFEKDEPAIDTSIFSGATLDDHFSSTTAHYNRKRMMSLSFYTGSMNHSDDKLWSNIVRAVRSVK